MNENINLLDKLGKQARIAARALQQASTQTKNGAILKLADALIQQADEVLAANARDVTSARQAGLSAAMIDRLLLNPDRLSSMADDLRRVAGLPDPVGEVFERATLANGLQAHKQRVPLGVIAVIYESRPNVTLDVSSLAIKTGNAVILRGGSETLDTNRALVSLVQDALQTMGLPRTAVQFIDSPDRELVNQLLSMYESIDMLIPRGGASLHQYCRENSRIPVITGGIGICHLFVDESADLEGSLLVIHNAKVQRPTVCNALDTLLVHRAVAADFLPRVMETLGASGVTFRAHASAAPFLAKPLDNDHLPGGVSLAGEQDFDTEWLSLVLGLKVVDGLEQALEHIHAHSTGHSDGILTQDDENAQRFIAEVDSAAVYVNASTRFTDGGQLGLGAEVAISTQRLHARGPMGLRELTTYKWVIQGDYHVRG